MYLFETKRHYKPFIKSTGNNKGCPWDWGLFHCDLMKARLEIKFRKDFSTTNSFEQRIDTGEGVLVFKGVVIEGAIIEHHPLLAFDLFSGDWVNCGSRINQHGHSTMSGRTWPYDAKLEERINVLFKSILHCWCNVLQRLVLNSDVRIDDFNGTKFPILLPMS